MSEFSLEMTSSSLHHCQPIKAPPLAFLLVARRSLRTQNPKSEITLQQQHGDSRLPDKGVSQIVTAALTVEYIFEILFKRTAQKACSPLTLKREYLGHLGAAAYSCFRNSHGARGTFDLLH